MKTVCLFASPLLVDASSVLNYSTLKVLGFRWDPAPFHHRSAGWFLLSHVGHFGYSFFWYPDRHCVFVPAFLSSNSRSKCVTISSYVAFSSFAMLTERSRFDGNFAYRRLQSWPGHVRQTPFQLLG